MRRVLAFAVMFLYTAVSIVAQDRATQTDLRPEPVLPDPKIVLQAACDLAFQVGEQERYWSDSVLLRIADVQIRAHDFDSAVRTIRKSSYDYGRNERLRRLAESLANDGQLERGLEVLRLYYPDRSAFEDGLRVNGIEHLIAVGDLNSVPAVIQQLKTPWKRADAHRLLAVAYAKSGADVLADEQFNIALSAADSMDNEFERLGAFVQIAEALLFHGKRDAAKATFRDRVNPASVKEPFYKILAFLRSATLAAKLGDEVNARVLFDQAVAAQVNVNPMNESNAFRVISEAQAKVGYIDDAMRTSELIRCYEKENGFVEGFCDKAQCQMTIAIAQFKKGNVDGAYRTTESIREEYNQYQDDAYYAFVGHQVQQGNLQTACVTANKIRQLSKRAVALLTIAKASSIAGDRKRATDVAAEINLPCGGHNLDFESFQFQLPRTWGLTFDGHIGLSSLFAAQHRSAEVASAAMALSLSLDQPPTESCAVLFDKFVPEVICALAREHARSGNANEAFIWAKQIGDDKIAKANENSVADSRGVKRRIDALIGVAEGILDRKNVARTKPY